MRWMGKVAYRCRDCQKRFYVDIDVDRRLRRAQDWKRRSEEMATTEREQAARPEGEFAKPGDSGA